MKWISFANTRPGRHALRIFGHYFGVERSMVQLYGKPYLLRYILYCGPIGFRLHKFFRGDEDRAPHDHPFWFITMPLGTGYYEQVYGEGSLACNELIRRAENIPAHHWVPRLRYVRPWRFHYRRASFKHIVLGRTRSGDRDERPFWTFVVFGFSGNPLWGYYPTPETFIPWTTWGNNYEPAHRL